MTLRKVATAVCILGTMLTATGQAHAIRWARVPAEGLRWQSEECFDLTTGGGLRNKCTFSKLVRITPPTEYRSTAGTVNVHIVSSNTTVFSQAFLAALSWDGLVVDTSPPYRHDVMAVWISGLSAAVAMHDHV